MTRRETIISRIWERVEWRGECLVWTGPTSGNGRGGGYPRACLDGHTVAVHRVVYTHFNGFIPGKKQIDHTCGNRLCLNPDHLEMVTHKENQKRRDRRAKTEGPEGVERADQVRGESEAVLSGSPDLCDPERGRQIPDGGD